jgi:HemY protein
MIRILLFLAALAALAFGFAWVADLPGGLALTLAGYRYETSLVAGLAIGLALLAVAMVAWSVVRFVFRIPGLMSFTARMRRRDKGLAALTRGMVAVGAGDRRMAAKAAREAEKLIGEEPLALLLAAQAAQLEGDRARAERLFQRMADRPETQMLGLRGLHAEARRRGDEAAAEAFARRAHDLAAPDWASDAMLERAAMADDWKAALAIVEAGAARKSIDRASADRQRAALKTAMALELRERDPAEALALAREAIRLNPALAPASALAGELLARRGDYRRATKLLEGAWRLGPHPDIARAYVEIRHGDSAADRLARAKTLARLAPGEAESALALARAGVEARDFALARQAMADLFGNGRRPTARMCLVMADLEETEHGPSGRVREWLARAARAARDPAWVADGIVSDEWLPASPATGRIDAFRWETPVERLGPGGAGRLDAGERPPILDAEPAQALSAADQAPRAARLAALQATLQATLESARARPPAPAQEAPATPAAPQGARVDKAGERDAPKDVSKDSPKDSPKDVSKDLDPSKGSPKSERTDMGAARLADGAKEPLLPASLLTAPDDPGPDAPEPSEAPPAGRPPAL